MNIKMVVISDIAEVNPKTDLGGLTPENPVSFIPMADVNESGNWVGRQVRLLRDVRVGYTAFADDDILFAKITPCMENGKGAHVKGLVNGIGYGSTEFHVLRKKNNNDPRYIFHWLQTEQLRLRAIAYMGGSAGQQRVQKDFFSNYQLPAISTAEQVRIANLLDTINDAIHQSESVIAKLKQVRAGMLHDLLSYGLDEHGQLRDPVAHPEQFKDTRLGPIPKDWEVEQLGTLFVLGRGRVISQLDMARSPGKYPVFSSQSSNNGVFGYLNTYDFEGDYITWTTDGANAGTVFYRSGKFNCTNVCGTLKSKGKIVEPFGALVFAREAKKHVSYVGNPKLMNNVVSKIWLTFPNSINEQKYLVNSLNQFDNIINSESIEQNKLFLLKSGLQDDLLTGRVRVPETIMEGGHGE